MHLLPCCHATLLLLLQVYSWGDNEHGQQGNGSTISNRKPQQVPALKDHRITRIACGSSHSIAFASGSPTTTIDFTPVSFPVQNDPLGTNLTTRKSIEENLYIPEIKRPSLTRIILSLETYMKQQEALMHVQTALQIAYARDAIVNSLGGIASVATQKTVTDSSKESCETSGGLSEIAGAVTTVTGGGACSEEVSRKRVVLNVGAVVPSRLDDFTTLLTVEDARVLVDLLKLAVANRVGSKGKETLGAVLTAMGKANPMVSTL